MLSRLNSKYIVFLTLLSIITFSGTGKCYAVVYGYIPNSGADTLSVINTEDSAVTSSITVGDLINLTPTPYGVASAPAGDFVYVTNRSDNSLVQVDIQTGTIFKRHTVGTDPVGVAVGPDGRYVYVASQDGYLSIIDTTTDFDPTKIIVGTNLFGVAVSPDGNFIYVTDTTADAEIDHVLVINQADFNDVTSIELKIGSKPQGIAVTPSGLYVVVANSGDDTVSLINTATNEVSATIDIPVVEGSPDAVNSPFGVAITNDSLVAYVTNTQTDSVSKINLLTLTVTNISLTPITDPLSSPGSPRGVAANPYGNFVYVVDNTFGLVRSIAITDNTVSSEVFTVGAAPVGLGKFFPPEVPSDLTATLVGDTGIDLSWSDNAVSETGYKIERKKFSGGSFTEIAQVGADVTSYNDVDLGNYANYYYRVRAYNAIGNTSYSNVASAQTNREAYSGCFIATAAYGSLLEPQVRLLRKFRDRYLAINQPGRAFLDMYYEYSPPIARYIANHNFWRFLVRWSLLPLVAMSWLSLTIGLLPAVLVLSSLSGLTAFLFLRRYQALAGQ